MGDLDRAAYLRHRYGGSQRLVDWREKRLVTALLAKLEGPLSCALDAPSGHGRFTSLLRGACPAVVSADSDLRHLLALRRAEASAPALVQLDLRSDLPFADGAFDLVFSVRFLHHVRERTWREHVLSELVRVSRRYVLVSYYEAASLHSIQKSLQHLIKPRRGRKLSMVPRKELADRLQALGCKLLADSAILPGFHAHRMLLAERQ